MERVADYVIERLVEKGIKHIFLITGRGILYLTDAVAKNKEIEAISTYHEQGASYAAMAYAAASDGMAACLVSTGCAATNAVTAVLCAYQDNLPIVFISGQNMLEETTRYTGQPIRTFGSQEADIISVVESITKYSVMLISAESVKYEMDKALYFAENGRKGPVWIDIPLDIQNSRIDRDQLHGYNKTEVDKGLDNKKISVLVSMLNKSERPIIFIGGGVRSAGAIDELAQFVNKVKMPVVFSTAAADAYGSGNELSIGAVGSLGGSRAGNFTVQNADLVIAIGTKLCSQSIGNAEQFAREAKLVVVDIDDNEHKKKGANIDLFIHADAKDFLMKMYEQDITVCYEKWRNKCLSWKEKFDVNKEVFIEKLKQENKNDLYHFADVLSSELPDDATVITDAGLEELIIPSTVKFHDSQRCLFPAAQGAMGYAIPAIIGAYYAGKKNIVTVVGDGSFMMNMQELLLIEKTNIPVKIFVINNNMYAVIRKRQKDLFRTRTIGNDPGDGVPAPDFRKIADCFGFQYSEISDETNLKSEIKNVLRKNVSCICEVHCEEEQKYLHISFGFNENRRLVKRPLEDLSPFIDRSVFKDEMIVKPIEE